jgi:hypothetical protein
MGSPAAWNRRIAQGLCKYCGKNPPDASRRSPHGPPPSGGSCTTCRQARYEKYKDEPYQSREKLRAYHILIKRMVFEKYSGKCEKCGEDRWECLTIDHINQDGAEDRKANPRSGLQWFLRLNREPRRLDLRVLCMSCNWSIAMWGYSGRDPSRPPQVPFAEALREYREKWSWRKKSPAWFKARYPDAV